MSDISVFFARSTIADKAIQIVEDFRTGKTHGVDAGMKINILLHTSFKMEEAYLRNQAQGTDHE
jgi:hypothetical protein